MQVSNTQSLNCVYYYDMSKKKTYNKPPLSIDAQMALLSERGLIISNEAQLRYFLNNINYYHLSIYFKCFQEGDAFRSGTTFDDVLRIYKFDNKLRFLLLDVLERIEKSFKCRYVQELSLATGNPHFYLDPRMYDSAEGLTKTTQVISDEFEKSKEPSVLHYKEEYAEPHLPPIWLVADLLSFGQCIKVCRNHTRTYRNKVAHTFGGDDEQFVLNWMQCLSVLRNHCAHHSRLWNREFSIRPKVKHKTYREIFEPNSMRLFNYLVVLQIILRNANPTSQWLTRLSTLVDEYHIDVVHMGFPEDWHTRLDGMMNK